MQHTGGVNLVSGGNCPVPYSFLKAVFMGNIFPLTVCLYREPFKSYKAVLSGNRLSKI